MIAEPLLPLLLNSSSSFYQPSSGDSVKEFQCRHLDPINEQGKLSNQSIEHSVSNISSSTIDHPSFPVRFNEWERERERNEKITSAWNEVSRPSRLFTSLPSYLQINLIDHNQFLFQRSWLSIKLIVAFRQSVMNKYIDPLFVRDIVFNGKNLLPIKRHVSLVDIFISMITHVCHSTIMFLHHLDI